MSGKVRSDERSEREFVEDIKRNLAAHPVYTHSFLRSFEERTLELSALRRFAVQWYKTAREHKIAFPALIYNTPIDDVRFELVEILRDEYGNGDREYIHAKLLARFLTALGISEAEVEMTETLSAVRTFGEKVLSIWRDGDPVVAFGLHFSLEFLAASLHAHFARGLRKYQNLSRDSREYFEYHKVAEEQHADYSEYGMEYYASSKENREKLEDGVRCGVRLLEDLWTDFEEHVLRAAA